ncbi:MAG: NusG domain II-containing protein [Ruminococcaceae bacterium]|nr:NusG domain II-containing protein [Oscillospiraceae bacterium]
MNKQTEKAPIVSNGGRKIKNDIIFIIFLLLIVWCVGLIYALSRADGDTVIVTVNGEITGEYALSDDLTINIESGEGQYNVLVIKDGFAGVEKASCPDGICVAHKPISKDSESIVCLPNKVVVTVKKSEFNDSPDIIA